MIRKTVKEDYNLQVLDSLYISIENIVELKKKSYLKEPLSKTSPSILLSHINPSQLYPLLRSRTLTFQKEQILSSSPTQKHNIYVAALENIVFCTDFNLNIKCKFTCKASLSNDGPLLEVKITDRTQLLLSNQLDLQSNVYGLRYCCNPVSFQLELLPIPYKAIENELNNLLQSQQKKDLSSLWKYFKEFKQSNIRDSTEINFHSIPHLISAPHQSGATTALCLFAKMQNIPLLRVSILDLMKKKLLEITEVEALFHQIVNLALAQEYAVLLFDDLWTLNTLLESDFSIKKGSESSLDCQYDSRACHFVLSAFREFLQQFMSLDNSNHSDLRQRLLPVVIIPNEDSLDRSILSLIPQQYDWKADLQVSPQYLFTLICSWYHDSQLTFADFEYRADANSKLSHSGELFLIPLIQYLILPPSSSTSTSSLEETVQYRFDSLHAALIALGFQEKQKSLLPLPEKQIDSRILSSLHSPHYLYGMQEILKRFEELILWPCQYRELYQAFGLSSAKAQSLSIQHVLLYGPSGKGILLSFFPSISNRQDNGDVGCGKSKLPALLSEHFNFQLHQINIATLISGSIGGTEQAILQIFQQAKRQAPCFVVLDEITAVFQKDASEEHSGSGGGSYNTILSTFIQSLEDINNWNRYNQQPEKSFLQSKQVLVIGITREPWLLPPRLFGYGRFQHCLLIDSPGESARQEMIRDQFQSLEGMVESKQGISKEDLQEWSFQTEGWSGADLQRVFQRIRNRILLQQHQQPSEYSQLDLIALMKEELRLFSSSIPSMLRDRVRSWKR